MIKRLCVDDAAANYPDGLVCADFEVQRLEQLLQRATILLRRYLSGSTRFSFLDNEAANVLADAREALGE
jgi:hypothetical protein